MFFDPKNPAEHCFRPIMPAALHGLSRSGSIRRFSGRFLGSFCGEAAHTLLGEPVSSERDAAGSESG